MSGLAQNTALGRFLFIMTFLGMHSATQRTTLRNYADDTKVSHVIQNPKGALHLKRELD